MLQTSQPDLLEEVDVDLDALIENPKALIIYNDDVNTFDHVIDSLVKICKHELIQAEQCTWLIHFTGKCVVKNDSYNKLKPMCEALQDRGLSATIES
jgi:ATP-dependent Clp protease adaptor protein ClpS